MTWWQTTLTVWAAGGILVFLFFIWASGREETHHGHDILTATAVAGFFVWPIYVAVLPFAGLYWLLGLHQRGLRQ